MLILGQTRRQNMRMKSAHTMKKRGIRTKNGCRFLWNLKTGNVILEV